MFEAIHGSAPDIAGQDIANPSGLIRASVLMLNHLGQQDVAEKIQNAISCVIEAGIHTPDIYVEGTSSNKVGTAGFDRAVIEHLGQTPQHHEKAEFYKSVRLNLHSYKRKAPKKKELKGVDVFVGWKGYDAEELARKLQPLNGEMKLRMITNRGVKVWPDGLPETFFTDHWRCRYEPEKDQQISKQHIVALLSKAILEDVDVIKTENLYAFDGQRAYSLGQGQ